MVKWQLQKERKINPHGEIVNMYNGNEAFIPEVVKNKEENHTSFAVSLQNTKVIVTVCDEGLVQVEETLRSKTWTNEMCSN